MKKGVIRTVMQLPGDIFAVLLQLDSARWSELSLADDLFNLRQKKIIKAIVIIIDSVAFRVSMNKKIIMNIIIHLRLLNLLLNSDHFQPTAGGQRLQ